MNLKLSDAIDVDAIAHDPRLLPYHGWHDEQPAGGAYLPAIQQWRAEFMAFVETATALGGFTKNVLLLGLGVGGAMHTIFDQLSQGCCITIDQDESVITRFTTVMGTGKGQIVSGCTQDPVIKERVSLLGPYSLLFVDADHTYKGVCSDLTLYPPLVDEGGIVAIHDVREGYPGVLRAVGELHEDVKLINPCLLGIAYYQQALQ